MTFDELLAQVQALLQREGRVSYRGLKRRLGLDDEYLEDLKTELIKAKRLAVDEEGEVLVWVDASLASPSRSEDGIQSLDSRHEKPALAIQLQDAARLLPPASRAEGERRQ